MDTGKDGRIDFGEFEKSLKTLKKWGVVVKDAKKAFAEIDENGGGQVLFDEFSAWALKQGLDYDKSIDSGHQEDDLKHLGNVKKEVHKAKSTRKEKSIQDRLYRN
eukprot:UN33054